MAARGRGGPRGREEIVPAIQIIRANAMVVDIKFRQLVVDAGLNIEDPSTCIAWLATRRLLVNSRECETCAGNVRCRLTRCVQAVNDHLEWRYANFRQCNFRKSLRHASFFQTVN